MRATLWDLAPCRSESRKSGRRMYLWLYSLAWPFEARKGYHCFPPYAAHVIADNYAVFAAPGSGMPSDACVRPHYRTCVLETATEREGAPRPVFMLHGGRAAAMGDRCETAGGRRGNGPEGIRSGFEDGLLYDLALTVAGAGHPGGRRTVRR